MLAELDTSFSTGMQPGINARGVCGLRSGNHPERGEGIDSPRTHTRAWRVELEAPNVRQRNFIEKDARRLADVWNQLLTWSKQRYVDERAFRDNVAARRADPRFAEADDAARQCWAVAVAFMPRMGKYDKSLYPGHFGYYSYYCHLRDTHAWWWKYIPQIAVSEVCSELHLAMQAFFRRVKHGDASAGFPRFKTLERANICIRFQKVRVTRRGLEPSGMIGFLKFKEVDYVPEFAREQIKAATIRYYGGKWWATITADAPVRALESVGRKLTIDATSSERVVCVGDGIDGQLVFDLPAPLQTELRKLKRLSRRVSRRHLTSNRRAKASKSLQIFHRRIADKRSEWARKTTTDIIRRWDTIEVLRERLLVKKPDGLEESDSGRGEFFRQLKYKVGWYGGTYAESVVE